MPISSKIHVLYEDNHLLIVNKPAGLLAQGDRTGDQTLLDVCKQYLKEKYNKPGEVFLGLVHRLDRPVSGVIVLARTTKALQRMNDIFKNRKVEKTYWAVVKRRPSDKSGKLDHWLQKDSQKNITSAYTTQADGRQKAELKYQSLGKLNDFYLLEVAPLTGRSHQIRAQLSSIRCPIRGDLKYGYPKANEDGNINLHARSLRFLHPVKKQPLLVIAPVPENDFWEQFLKLDKGKIKDQDLGIVH